ncbi:MULTISPECIES: MFS transporter [Pseudomonas]|uniref:MFS transporter n=1 Tax=Pseudomonas quercus TaxID=2722792 RepID=A0ABX0YBD6_9PSED|nr:MULTISPECIES: MFS transporter [Pseudomonas]MBF7141067.1 MFS transporter [Pseudomonas sp. LY10J]NJO99601.1 MFS transporter [Pseudomonas quercus]
MTASTPEHPPLTPALVLLFAFCCGAIVANIYYSQPIIELIAPAIGLSAHGASLVVSLTQVGYALGLFLLVPLADLLENRRLILATVVLSALSLLGAAFSVRADVFLAISLLIGFSSVAVQMLIPMAAHMAPEASRGRVVGNIMSGLILGILLARPVASVVADHLGWRAVFIVAAGVSVAILALLAFTLPRRQPAHSASYGELLLSMLQLLKRFPALRERALYQALMFGAFSLFWTTVPVELTRVYGLSQTQIALFALVGAIGAVAAPIAGRLADAGHGQAATLLALILAPLAFLVGWLPKGVIALAITGLVLDFAVQMSMVTGQRIIYELDASSRARLNGLYVTSIFIGGALGSAFASSLYERAGWGGIVALGMALPALGLAIFALRWRRHS